MDFEAAEFMFIVVHIYLVLLCYMIKHTIKDNCVVI